MDAFVTKLFDGSPESKRAAATLGDSAWVFSCVCGQCYTSEDSDYTVEVGSRPLPALSCVLSPATDVDWAMVMRQGQWFECSKCKIWAHLACVHQDLGHMTVRFVAW